MLICCIAFFIFFNIILYYNFFFEIFLSCVLNNIFVYKYCRNIFLNNSRPQIFFILWIENWIENWKNSRLTGLITDGIKTGIACSVLYYMKKKSNEFKSGDVVDSCINVIFYTITYYVIFKLILYLIVISELIYTVEISIHIIKVLHKLFPLLGKLQSC